MRADAQLLGYFSSPDWVGVSRQEPCSAVVATRGADRCQVRGGNGTDCQEERVAEVVSSFSQLSSGQRRAAARASLRRTNGPRRGPLTGDRSANQLPCMPALTWLARRTDKWPRQARSIVPP